MRRAFTLETQWSVREITHDLIQTDEIPPQ
jgi:hypothetical protein